jgi:hypothetical protein
VEWIFVLAVGLVGGTLGGIVGFGTSILLLPPLVIVFGPREAVPIMAIVALMGNGSRVAVWWREVDWRACAAFSATGAPCAALGAMTLMKIPPGAAELALGVFFLAMIPLRRMLSTSGRKARLPHLALGGAIVGYLTGIVASTGPISTPWFLAHGLTRGAFLSTEAMSSIAVYLSKAATFNQLGALDWPVAAKGLIVGSSVMAGSFVAKRFVLRLEPEQFRLLMDGLMLAAGVTMIGAAVM